MQIVAKKISKKSLFKLLSVGLILGFSLFAIPCGIFAFFGAETIEWNGVYKTGIEGLLYSFVMGPIIGLIFACFMWVFIALGLWIYSFFMPLKVTFKNIMDEPADVA